MYETMLPREFPGGRLRKLRLSDHEAFQAYRGIPGLGRYQGWVPMSDAAALDFLAGMGQAPLFAAGRWVQLGIADLQSDCLVGDIGVYLSEDGHRGEVGFTLQPSAQGQGLASRAVREALQLFFSTTTVARVLGITDERNLPGIRLLDRLGFEHIESRHVVFRGEPCTERVYALSRNAAIPSPEPTRPAAVATLPLRRAAHSQRLGSTSPESLMQRSVTTTCLEMTDRAQLRPARPASLDFQLLQADIPCPELNRFLYTAVGADWWWYTRLSWDYAQWLAYLDRPELETWVAYAGGTPAGYFELERQDAGNVEIAYFGLLPNAIGKGLGGALLAAAISRAWDIGAARVWVHTCTLDHPKALRNYQARGFKVFRTDETLEDLPDHPLEPWPGARVRR